MKKIFSIHRTQFLLGIVFFFLFSSAFAYDLENYTYRLTESTSNITLWTTSPSERVFKDDAIPSDSLSGVRVYAAKNEFEPFQVVVQPDTDQNLAVNMGDFGNGITTEIHRVRYVNIDQATDSLGQTGPYPDPLWPVEKGESVSLAANENTAFWITVYVPKTVASGDYQANVTIGSLSVPVTLHVFNFAIPDELHVKSQMNVSHNTFLDKYSVPCCDTEYWQFVNMTKQFFIDHRLTPKGPLWPGGLTSGGGSSFIDYDCSTGTFTDPHGIWGFEIPLKKYIGGREISGQSGNNGIFNEGTGFPSFMAMTFLNNDASQDQRPYEFCGITRDANDWYTADNPESSFNSKWFAYIKDIQDYLASLGYLEKAYYYFANEPQGQEAYDAVAWYSRYLKQAAPDFKLMVSEEPKPEIYNHSDYVSDSQIDIWLPVLNNFDPDTSRDREVNHGEETWIYFLHGTRPPYFNPITLDHPGIESKFTGWFLWKYRIRGIAYYSLNQWWKNPWTDPIQDGHNGDLFMFYPPSTDNSIITYGANNNRLVPSIRIELMRDSLEDYEYFYLLSGKTNPQWDTANEADAQVDKIIQGTTSYTRNSRFMYNLRKLIGQKIGGEITTIPDIEPPTDHPRATGPPGNYYLNFQDPDGKPTDSPLVVNGNEYMKIGWNEYDKNLGYGWFGDMAHVMYAYASSAPSVLQASILYDDWGRRKTFEFDLPSGVYDVTVSVGRQEKTYPKNFIEIEGVNFVNGEETNLYIVRTKRVSINDKKLTMEMGIFDEYTMLNYMVIENTLVKGDITGDGELKIDDAEKTMLPLVGLEPALSPNGDVLMGDYDGDNVIGISDIIGILQEVSGNGRQ